MDFFAVLEAEKSTVRVPADLCVQILSGSQKSTSASSQSRQGRKFSGPLQKAINPTCGGSTLITESFPRPTPIISHMGLSFNMNFRRDTNIQSTPATIPLILDF